MKDVVSTIAGLVVRGAIFSFYKVLSCPTTGKLLRRCNPVYCNRFNFPTQDLRLGAGPLLRCSAASLHVNQLRTVNGFSPCHPRHQRIGLAATSLSISRSEALARATSCQQPSAPQVSSVLSFAGPTATQSPRSVRCHGRFIYLVCSWPVVLFRLCVQLYVQKSDPL